MKKVFLIIYRILLLLLALSCVSFVFGCGEAEESSLDAASPEPVSEETSPASSEPDEPSEIELPDESSDEPSEEPYDPGVYRPYRDANEPKLEDIVLQSEIPVTGIRIDPANISIGEGEIVLLPFEIRPFTSGMPRTYTVSDPEILSVSETGFVTGLQPGKATVTLESGGKKATCHVTVKDAGDETPLHRLLAGLTGTEDRRLWKFALYDFDGDGENELIARHFYTESGIPEAAICRISDGELLLSAFVGAAYEHWTVRSGSFAEKFILVAHTEYPSMSGALVCRDALTVKDGVYTLTRLSERRTTVGGGFDYAALVDGELVSCDRATYRKYVEDETVSRFEKDNPASEELRFFGGISLYEIEDLLLNPPPLPKN